MAKDERRITQSPNHPIGNRKSQIANHKSGGGRVLAWVLSGLLILLAAASASAQGAQV